MHHRHKLPSKPRDQGHAGCSRAGRPAGRLSTSWLAAGLTIWLTKLAACKVFGQPQPAVWTDSPLHQAGAWRACASRAHVHTVSPLLSRLFLAHSSSGCRVRQRHSPYGMDQQAKQSSALYQQGARQAWLLTQEASSARGVSKAARLAIWEGHACGVGDSVQCQHGSTWTSECAEVHSQRVRNTYLTRVLEFSRHVSVRTSALKNWSAKPTREGKCMYATQEVAMRKRAACCSRFVAGQHVHRDCCKLRCGLVGSSVSLHCALRDGLVAVVSRDCHTSCDGGIVWSPPRLGGGCHNRLLGTQGLDEAQDQLLRMHSFMRTGTHAHSSPHF